MHTILLALWLSLQMLLPAPGRPELIYTRVEEQPHVQRLMWGMLDPELSAWYAHVPSDEQVSGHIEWCWSWRAFWAALTGQPIVKEASTDAPVLS